MAPPHRTKENLRAEYLQLTDAIVQSAYDVKAWQARGDFFRSGDYHDLAIGDYYKALLLTDDALDSSGEYHSQALDALGFGVGETDDDDDDDNDDDDDEIPDAVALPFKRHALSCYANLVDCLLELGAHRTAKHFADLGLKADVGDDSELAELRTNLLTVSMNGLATEGEPATLNQFVLARRELYPWNEHEPERYSPESIDLLNSRLHEVAPKCIVKAVDLPILYSDTNTSGEATLSSLSGHSTVKQLGLFAREDIHPGESVLVEKSLLAVNNRLHDELCDACSAELPANPAAAFACGDCMTAIFCSQDCLDQAVQSYHTAVCGNDDFEAINKDVEAKDASSALYGLLLGRALAMAETQDVNPLDLLEVSFLWGDYSSWQEPSARGTGKLTARPRTLPWSFEHNIANPIHMLTMLDVDIYATVGKFDFWILNTLYAKFRGVANARMNARTGKPEVAASHYRWCLANHSCAPNVSWEWGGKIKMWVRDGSKGEVVKWGKDRDKKQWLGGIKAGDEILNHYCDVGLPVKERREWAAGALGGMCMCQRCIWEASEDMEGISN